MIHYLTGKMYPKEDPRDFYYFLKMIRNFRDYDTLNCFIFIIF